MSDDLTTVIVVCGSRSAQGTICAREPGHTGCHEAFIEGDSRRWWGDSRWAPWEWMVYEFETGDKHRPPPTPRRTLRPAPPPQGFERRVH